MTVRMFQGIAHEMNEIEYELSNAKGIFGLQL